MVISEIMVGDTILIKEWNTMLSDYKLDSDGNIFDANCEVCFYRDDSFMCGNFYTVKRTSDCGVIINNTVLGEIVVPYFAIESIIYRPINNCVRKQYKG